MYLREKRMFILNIKNIILYIVGMLFCVSSIFVYIANYISYSDNAELRSMVNSKDAVYIVFGIGLGLLCLAFLSRWLMGEARFFSNYFEMDLDGYIAYSDLGLVTGKSNTFTMLLLSILKPLYMKGFSFDNLNKSYQIILNSKTCECQCRNCAAVIEQKTYFTGICSYCGSSDLNAKIISGERFYNIRTDLSLGHGKPEFYRGKHVMGKRTAYIICAFVCIGIALINMMYALDRITHINDREYLRKEFARYLSYELLRKEAQNSAAFGFCFMIGFTVIAVFMLSKTVKLSRVVKGSQFLAGQKSPFITESVMRKNFHRNKPFKKLKAIQKCGYMRSFTFEKHNSKMMLAVAKQVVKDKCPSCAAPITGAVYEDYICTYCGNKIMGVIRRAQ